MRALGSPSKTVGFSGDDVSSPTRSPGRKANTGDDSDYDTKSCATSPTRTAGMSAMDGILSGSAS